MQQKVHPFQLNTAGREIQGSFTDRNHLYTALADDPVTLMSTIQTVMDVNLGKSIYDQIRSKATEYIETGAEGIYQWVLDYFVESNYECIGAWKYASGDVAGSELVDGDKLYAGYAIYLDFNGKPFSETEIIAGMNPENDRFLVKEVISARLGVTRYKVEMAHSSGPDSFFDFSQFAPGTFWSREAGAVSEYMSHTGVDISFRTPVRAEAEMSNFRVEHKVHGKNADWTPKWFYMPDESGKVTSKKPKLWMTTVEYEFLKTIRRIEANISMYGRSNKWADGGRGNYDDKNGYPIKIGAGWHEQKLSSNYHYYVGSPSLGEIEQIIMTAVVGRTNQREVLIKGGEYGLMELSNMVKREFGSDAYKANPWATDTSGRNFQWNGNKVFVNMGQVTGVWMNNDIKVMFVLDPSKDMEGRNKVKMPGKPGWVDSYKYDIIGFGNTTEDSNMRIVRRKGEMGIFGMVEGMRSHIKRATSFNAPKAMANPVDAFSIHYFEPGLGAKLNDPTGWISYYPSVARYV